MHDISRTPPSSYPCLRMHQYKSESPRVRENRACLSSVPQSAFAQDLQADRTSDAHQPIEETLDVRAFFALSQHLGKIGCYNARMRDERDVSIRELPVPANHTIVEEEVIDPLVFPNVLSRRDFVCLCSWLRTLYKSGVIHESLRVA